MDQCPHCGAWFGVASAWSRPEVEIDPDNPEYTGVLCPSCGEFISDAEMEDAAAEDEDDGPE